MDTLYGTEHSVESDLAAMSRAFGSWEDRDLDGAAWVDHFPMFPELRLPY